MPTDLQATLSSLSRMPSGDATQHFSQLASQANNALVKVRWEVVYDPDGHDMHSVATVSLANPGGALLQVWLSNVAGGIWLPDKQPWVTSAVEFKPEQRIESAKLGLLDSKWTGDDLGRQYAYRLWGYFLHGTSVESFAFERWADFPGDAPR